MFKILIFAFCILNFIGCAATKEYAKGLWGVSTKQLEEGRKDAVKQAFKCALDKCYNDVLSGIKTYGCYIYAQNPREKMIALYISEEDTTAVGIFFKAIDDNNTQIEVSSPSTYGKELIASRVDNIFNPKKKEGTKNAEEKVTDKQSY